MVLLFSCLFAQFSVRGHLWPNLGQLEDQIFYDRKGLELAEVKNRDPILTGTTKQDTGEPRRPGSFQRQTGLRYWAAFCSSLSSYLCAPGF
jgi:hypothetical protein